jgi:hypothetical protein
MDTGQRFRSKRTVLSLVAALFLAGAAIWYVLSWGQESIAVAQAQTGIGPEGATAFEYIGRIDQEGFTFRAYGYLTYIRGLDHDQLFTGSDPANASESDARFTMVADAILTSRSILTEVFNINSTGVITIYFTETPPARTFDDPASFAAGTPIATTTVRYQDILLVQAPNRGLAIGTAELSQQSSTPFILGGESYNFGRPGLPYRFYSIGNATRTDAELPRSFVLAAGHATTGGQQTFFPFITQNGP